MAEKKTASADISKLSFEEAMAELETIVRQLEAGQVKLDEAMTAYERGAALRRHCEARLKDAEAKIERITQLGDGSLTTQPLEGQ